MDNRKALEWFLRRRGEMSVDERLRVNRDSWNERVPTHAASDFYDVESFKSGRITLMDIERREIGDVSGKTLLHLQCHLRSGYYVMGAAGGEGDGRGFLRCRNRPGAWAQ